MLKYTKKNRKFKQDTKHTNTENKSGNFWGGSSVIVISVSKAMVITERKNKYCIILGRNVKLGRYFLTEMEKDFNCNSSSQIFSNIEKQVAQAMKKAITVTSEGSSSPSFNSRGSILNVDTSKNQVDIKGISFKTKQTGNDTKRMDFSCTWKENKKNDSAQPTRVNLNPLGEGWSINFTHAGSRLRNVKQKLIIIWMSRGKISLIFRKTLKLHQTLATLSSNSPRSTGKSLLRTCSVCSLSVKNGSQQRMKEPATVQASLSKSANLRRNKGNR